MTDIEDLLAAAADDTGRPLPYSVEELVERGRRSVRQRRIAAIATAALTTVAIIGGVTAWTANRSDSVAPAGPPTGQTLTIDVKTGRIIDKETGKPLLPPPPASELADAEIIRRCGQNDKEWLESMPNSGDKAGPISTKWTLPLKTGHADVFTAVLIAPDRTIAATCHMEGKTISTGGSSYGRFPLADTPPQPELPTAISTRGLLTVGAWGRVPEVVTRVVAIPTKGEPREALVSNGYFTWGPAQGAAGVPARVLGYDATGKVVFDAQSVVPAS